MASLSEQTLSIFSWLRRILIKKSPPGRFFYNSSIKQISHRFQRELISPHISSSNIEILCKQEGKCSFYVSALKGRVVGWARRASFIFFFRALATTAGSLNGSSMRLSREEFTHINVTKNALNKIQATTMVMIKTVMAYSYLLSSSKRTGSLRSLFLAWSLTAQHNVVSLGGPAILQSKTG